MIERFTILFHYIKTKFFSSFSSREKLLAWQDRSVQKHIKRTMRKSSFYRDLYQGRQISFWREFPIIEKKEMMDHFTELNTANISKEKGFEVALKAEKMRDFSPTIKDITVGLSSGTSGNRGIFLVSPFERRKWAGNILAKTLPGRITKENKIAFFLRANSNLYNSVNKGKIKFSFFDLEEETENLISKLNDFNPNILVAPPSMLRIIAHEMESGKLSLSPDKVISVAEVLERFDEHFLEEVFNQKIHQVYQCTEGFIASTCSHGNLHLNEDLLVIQKEYIDKEKSRFFPIITDFSRKTQPIIRYRLNDILIECNDSCPCGSIFTRIQTIEGRSDDLFYGKKEDGTLVPVFPDFIRRCVLFSSDDIEEYKIIQTSPSSIDLFLSGDFNEKDVQGKIQHELLQLFSEKELMTPVLTFYPYLPEAVRTKKLRRIQRNFDVN